MAASHHPIGSESSLRNNGATQRAAATPSRDPNGARRAAKRDGDGILADLGAGKGRSRDSGGETRAIDYGELLTRSVALVGLSTRDHAPKA